MADEDGRVKHLCKACGRAMAGGLLFFCLECAPGQATAPPAVQSVVEISPAAPADTDVPHVHAELEAEHVPGPEIGAPLVRYVHLADAGAAV